MIEIILTEKDIYRFIEEQKENISVFSTLWEVQLSKNEEKTSFFEFFSKQHYTNTIRPENFYKPTISIINFDENK